MEVTPIAFTEARFQACDVLLWQGQGLLSDMIRDATESDTTHIGWYLGEWGGVHLTIEADESPCGALSAQVIIKDLGAKLRGYDGRCLWAPLQPGLYKYREALRREALKWLGTPYDYKDVWKHGFHRVPLDTGSLYCSEFVQVVMARIIPSRVMRDYVMTPALKLLMDGEYGMVPGDFEELWLLQLNNIKELVLWTI